MVGVGGIGGGMFLALEGTHTLGREESRGARLLDVRDACKLHIVAHHVATLLGADASGTPFRVVPLGDVAALQQALSDALSKDWDRTAILDYARDNQWDKRVAELCRAAERSA